MRKNKEHTNDNGSWIIACFERRRIFLSRFSLADTTAALKAMLVAGWLVVKDLDTVSVQNQWNSDVRNVGTADNCNYIHCVAAAVMVVLFVWPQKRFCATRL